MLKRWQTYIVVTLVTLLIWVWAEAETQRGDGTASCVVAEIPVLVAMKPGSTARAVVEPGSLKNVRVIGPPDSIDRIRGGTTLTAVALTNDRALESDVAVVPVDLVAPPMGVRLAEPATVTIRVTRSQ